ncbi:MAG: hypothetical protein J5736_01750 [Bacilli bacterium]|nr:hypothetical protein [Bacilli bacterium]
MLSSVFLSGRLGEVKDNRTRIVEVEHLIPGPMGRFAVSKLPVRSPLPDTLLVKASAGALIVLKGRLEADEKDGTLYIIDEVDEIYPLPASMKRM